MLESILLGVLLVVTGVYLYLSHHYSYWKRRGLPQLPTVLGFGNFYDVLLLRKNPGSVFDEAYRSYPEHDAVGLYGFHSPKLLVRSPELIKKVLVSEFSSFHDNLFSVSKKLDPHFYEDPFCLNGDEWKPARAKLVASMTVNRMKEIYPLIKTIIPRVNAYLDGLAEKEINAKELATLFMMDNVSNVVFGIDSDCFSDPGAPFRKMGEVLFEESLRGNWRTVVLFLLPKLRDLLGMRFTPMPVNNFIEQLVKDVIESRTKNNSNRNDLFQHFIKKEGNDINEIVHQGMTFFLEGFETSSMVASSALYELALNPGSQQRLYEELRQVLGDKVDPDFDTLTNDLPFLDNVLQETQRKYPVMFAFERVCTKHVTLEINGRSVDVEPGTSVVVPVFSVHRDPQHFPDPERFEPERFSSAPTPYTFMPFGEGSRLCPGIRFGLTQVKLLVASVVLKYELQRCPKTPLRLTFAPGAFLVTPQEELCVRLHRRGRPSQKRS